MAEVVVFLCKSHVTVRGTFSVLGFFVRGFCAGGGGCVRGLYWGFVCRGCREGVLC